MKTVQQVKFFIDGGYFLQYIDSCGNFEQAIKHYIAQFNTIYKDRPDMQITSYEVLQKGVEV